MNENKLAIYHDFTQISQAADALYKSGYFGADVKSAAQAMVKVMAGAELGLPPFASMTGINIVQGKPTLGANVIATLVKNDRRYDYDIVKCDETEALIDWYENGKKRGQSGFTIKEAQIAGLTNKDNWKKYPSDMLFARAISRGARRFAPGIFSGSPVYTPDELGIETDPEGYIDAIVTTPTTYPQDAGDIDREENEPTEQTPIVYDPKYAEVKNSDGILYTSIDTGRLGFMVTSMRKALKKDDYPEGKRTETEFKLEAAEAIIKARMS